jgi:hypothetical protein
MWLEKFFNTTARDALASTTKENELLRKEIKDLKQLIDELLMREREQKGIYHYSLQEKEKELEDAATQLKNLKACLDRNKQKRNKKPKNA